MLHLCTGPAAVVAHGFYLWTKNCYGGVLFVIGDAAAARVGGLGLSTKVVTAEGAARSGLDFRLRRVEGEGRQRRGRLKGLRHLRTRKVGKLDLKGLTRITRKLGKRLRLRRGTGLRHGGGRPRERRQPEERVWADPGM